MRVDVTNTNTKDVHVQGQELHHDDIEEFEIQTKRFSFGEMSQQLNEKQRIDPNDVIQLLKDPTAERFVRYGSLFAL